MSGTHTYLLVLMVMLFYFYNNTGRYIFLKEVPFGCQPVSVEYADGQRAGSRVLLTNKPAACSTGQVSPVTEKVVSITVYAVLMRGSDHGYVVLWSDVWVNRIGGADYISTSGGCGGPAAGSRASKSSGKATRRAVTRLMRSDD